MTFNGPAVYTHAPEQHELDHWDATGTDPVDGQLEQVERAQAATDREQERSQ